MVEFFFTLPLVECDVNNKFEDIFHHDIDIVTLWSYDLYDSVELYFIYNVKIRGINNMIKKDYLTLYHGSTKIVTNPQFGVGRKTNDYGPGVYCTQEIELAKEWSCQTIQDGYVNQYRLNINHLNIMDLTRMDYSTLHWQALLNDNRQPAITTVVGLEGAQYLRSRFLPDTANVDIIIGNRADDSYFSFVRSFLNNEITLAQLEKAMQLGNLGLQVMIKSEKAFQQLEYQGFEIADGNVYFGKRKKRDEDARQSFSEEQNKKNIDGIYMIDLIREEKGK